MTACLMIYKIPHLMSLGGGGLSGSESGFVGAFGEIDTKVLSCQLAIQNMSIVL